MSAMIRSLALLAIGLGLGNAVGSVRGQEGPPLPKPTAEHERLAREAGTWDATIKSWMAGPGAEPVVSRGVQIAKMMPGGLWLLSSFEGKFGDMEFHGAGQTGYDARKGKYVGTWVDSMSSDVTVMEGTYDEKARAMTMTSKGTDPAGKPYDMRMITRYESEDSMIFTMEMKMEETKGEFVKMVEISYKRRSK